MPTNSEEWLTSVVAVLLALAGIATAWAIYAGGRVKAPRPVTLFVKKFYWDEAYDWLFYRPSDALARGLMAFVERPLIAGSLNAVSAAAGLGSRELGRAQNGLVRSYALALAGGVAVLAVVFLSVR